MSIAEALANGSFQRSARVQARNGQRLLNLPAEVVFVGRA
jgi:hypothetical protein